MLDANLTYVIFAALAVVVFWRLPVRTAIVVIVLGGWIALPPTSYPATEAGVFPWWITGLALPSDMLISKAWIPTTVALFGALLRDRSALATYRASVLDGIVGLWCLWPLVTGHLIEDASPEPAIAALYLTGSWGAGWVLGRLWFGTVEAQMTFLKGFAWSGVACLPFAVLEGSGIANLHDLFYGPHPFQDDGAERYVGFRPLGMFEHGNQYGLWVSACALVAIWLAVATRGNREARVFLLVALLTSAMALAAQSAGAILLAVASLLVLALWRTGLMGPLLAAGGLSTVLLLALHLSNIVPLEHIARNTAFGQSLIATFDSIGRGSFLWRISQDVKSLQILDGHFILGTGRWDWWRPNGTRPWGLWLLLIGQFGLIGFLISYSPLVVAAVRTLVRQRNQSVWRRNSTAFVMALLVFFAASDSLLNAFFFFPAIVGAGAIVRSPAQGSERTSGARSPR